MTYDQLTSMTIFQMTELLSVTVQLSAGGFDILDDEGDLVLADCKDLHKVRAALVDVAADLVVEA